MDLCSLFRKDVDVGKALLDILFMQAEKSNRVIPPGEWELSGKFFIDSYGIVVLFQSNEKDINGEIQMMSFGYGWQTLGNYLDPNGALAKYATNFK
jgi:hypothetical protein